MQIWEHFERQVYQNITVGLVRNSRQCQRDKLNLFINWK